MVDWITSEDIAWAAGFFDGEGCIRIHKDKRDNQYRLQITVRQVDYRPIEKFLLLFGGSVFRQKGWSKNARPVYTWHQPAGRAIETLKKLYPYLVYKKDQADIAVDFQDTKVLKGKRVTDEVKALREDYFIRLKELKWQT